MDAHQIAVFFAPFFYRLVDHGAYKTAADVYCYSNHDFLTREQIRGMDS